VVGPAIPLNLSLYQKSSLGESGRTEVPVGGGFAVPDGDSAVVGEYSLLSDSVESRYEYATFRPLSNISSSADLARYLLETYNDRTHHVRFGAYALDDSIDLVVVELGAA
jgi:hypothetical protein